MIALSAALIAMLVVVAAPRAVRTGARKREARSRPARPGPLDIARLIERLATVVCSGVAPRSAWLAVAATASDGPLQDLARAVGAGAAPRNAARGPLAGSAAITALDAAVTVCETTGAPLGPVLLTLADGLRDVADAELARVSAFAGPLATARILLALPFAGIGLGFLLGADPLGLLLGGGRALLVAGLACTIAGWWWMHRLLRAARLDRAGVDASLVLDLVAGPLAAGSSLSHALVQVGAALGGDPLAAPLDSAGRALAHGVKASTALAHVPTGLRPLRDAALVAESTGADLVGLLRSSAQDARRGRARETEAAAARLAVRLVLPTGAALLPAFVLLGIIPTVASLLGGYFGSALP